MGNNKKLLIASLVIGAFAVVLVLLYGKSQSDKVEEFTSDQVEVAKAATELVAGTIFEKTSVYTEKVPRQFLPPNPLEASEIQMYVGTPIAVNVKKDGMILTSDFIAVAEATGLSSRIPTDERAMTMPVDEISGVAGLLNPGDRVDILATFPISTKDEIVEDVSKDGNASVGYLTVPMLQNVTLLAVGSRLSELGQSNQGGGYGSVTVSVTIDEAEFLTIAQTKGKITLLLRNAEDFQTATPSKKTLREVLEELEVIQKERTKRITKKPRPKAKKPGIEILRGDK